MGFVREWVGWISERLAGWACDITPWPAACPCYPMPPSPSLHRAAPHAPGKQKKVHTHTIRRVRAWGLSLWGLGRPYNDFGNPVMPPLLPALPTQRNARATLWQVPPEHAYKVAKRQIHTRIMQSIYSPILFYFFCFLQIFLSNDVIKKKNMPSGASKL